jgi:FAD/FMN-containing dehydrogenase
MPRIAARVSGDVPSRRRRIASRRRRIASRRRAAWKGPRATWTRLAAGATMDVASARARAGGPERGRQRAMSKNTLETGFRGAVIRPGDDGYDSARRVWNGIHDKRPALIARCTGVADVLHALRVAREHGLEVAVRSGGHSVAGHGTCDGGMVLDLSPMKGMWIDPEARTLRAQSGLTWGELYRETEAFGLTTAGGTLPGTGVAGFTLGGGISLLVRKYGLTIDNLLSADVITADGRLLHASADRNPELFWGLRGGGGNFGVVTSLEYRLHAVGPIVMGGVALYPARPEILQRYRDLAPELPDELSTIAILAIGAPPEPFVPEHMRGQPVIAIYCCHAGPVDQGLEAVRPLAALGQPLVSAFEPLPYTALIDMGETAATFGRRTRWRSHFLDALDDRAIATIFGHADRATSPHSHVVLYHLGGAFGRVARDATAFAHRDARYAFVAAAVWEDPDEDEAQLRWVEQCWQDMRPSAAGGVYVNFLDDGEAGRVGDAYGDNHRRLAAVKRQYDPENFFRVNHNVRPAP